MNKIQIPEGFEHVFKAALEKRSKAIDECGLRIMPSDSEPIKCEQSDDKQ